MAKDNIQIRRSTGEEKQVMHDQEMADLKEREDALLKNIADRNQLSALQAQFNSNKTYGRIQSLQCSRDESPPPPPPPKGTPEMKAWDEVSDRQQAEEKRRFANSLGIMAGGPVFAALPAAGRLLGAPEGVVENLGEINANIASAFALGGRGKAIEPVPTETWVSRPTGARSGAKPASSGDGTYVEKAPPPVPKVTATARVGNREFKGTNPEARENPDANKRTAAADKIEARKSFREGNPNTNMENAHAEVEAMQKAHDAGVTKGTDMTIELTGQNMCTYCRSNVATMADEIGLNSLTVQGPKGETSIWVKGSGWIQKGW